MGYVIRLARLDKCEGLQALIDLSARALYEADYTSEQIEAALRGAFGVDTELIRDGTYFVIECAGQMVACGGWSRRATLFGGDSHTQRNSSLLDPQTQPAKVRAFFVHPDHARHGLGRMLLDACELAAREHGFEQLELMATLTGERLYARCGFVARERIRYEAAPGIWLEFVPMQKAVSKA